MSDGDTATLLTAENKPVKIRLAQIDAPEKSQAFGESSKQSLYGKSVSVEIEAIDHYKRTVGKIIVNGMDANLEQVKLDMVWFYVRYGRDTAYQNAESKAKFQRVGLWSEPNPISPWEFSRGAKSSAAKQPTISDQHSGSINKSCGSKRYCKEMLSCDEAKLYLQQCGLRTIDGDGDGVPCEKLCR